MNVSERTSAKAAPEPDSPDERFADSAAHE